MIADFVREWWPIIVTLGSVAVSLASLLFRRSVPSREEFGKLAGRVDALEAAQESLPTREDLHALQLEMAEFRGEMRTTAVRMEGARRRVSGEVRGVKELLKAEVDGAIRLVLRTDNLQKLLTEHLLEREK